MKLLASAIKFAVEKHEGQTHKGAWPIPYVAHVMDVMKRTSKFTMDEEVLVAAILHDYIADCDLENSIEDKHQLLVLRFGKRVADLVMECTRVAGDDIPTNEKIKFLESFADKSFDSVLIKVAARYSNCADYLSDVGTQKCSDYFGEAKSLIKRFSEEATNEQRKQEAAFYTEIFRLY